MYPRTVSEAVDSILGETKAKDKRTVRDTPEEGLVEFHFGWGQGIRNSMGLWRGNIEFWKELQSMDDAEIEASSIANEDRMVFDEL